MVLLFALSAKRLIPSCEADVLIIQTLFTNHVGQLIADVFTMCCFSIWFLYAQGVTFYLLMSLGHRSLSSPPANIARFSFDLWKFVFIIYFLIVLNAMHMFWHVYVIHLYVDVLQVTNDEVQNFISAPLPAPTAFLKDMNLFVSIPRDINIEDTPLVSVDGCPAAVCFRYLLILFKQLLSLELPILD